MFTLEIGTGNSAFCGESKGEEIARILRAIADAIRDGQLTDGEIGSCIDRNGNRVGGWYYTDDKQNAD